MTDWQNKKLDRIIQRLKSIIFQDLTKEQRASIQTQLSNWREEYLAGRLPFDDYKFQALGLLCAQRDVNWVEQFLYREANELLTDGEKFQLLNQVKK